LRLYQQKDLFYIFYILVAVGGEETSWKYRSYANTCAGEHSRLHNSTCDLLRQSARILLSHPRADIKDKKQLIFTLDAK